MSMSRPGSFDPLSIIEAGYNLSASDPDWVRCIAEAASGQIGGPGGTLGYRFTRRPGFRYVPSAVSIVRGDPALVALTRDALRWYPAEAAKRFFGCMGIKSLHETSRFPMLPASLNRGLVDFCGLMIGNCESGVMVGTPLFHPLVVDSQTRQRWGRVAAHLSALFRLRSAVSVHSNAAVEAVLTPSARVIHAAGAAQHSDALKALRDAVRSMETARGRLRRADPNSALSLWQELVAGRWTLVDEFESDGRRVIVAHVNPPEVTALRELTPRQQSVIRLLLRGASSNSVAITLGITPSAVSQQLKHSLRKLRVRSLASLVSLRKHLADGGNQAVFDLSGVALCVATAAHRLDAFPAPHLSPAERHITSLILDGLSNSEIAEMRRCTYRTVANQIARLYEKLCVNSRTELALYFERGSVEPSSAPASRADGPRTSRA